MKGILFTEPMFLAATRKKKPKTQTRRIESALSVINENPDNWEVISDLLSGGFHFRDITKVAFFETAQPRYKKGEFIYLKEPFAIQEFSRPMLIAKVNYRYGGNEHHLIDISDKTAGALLKWKAPLNRWVSPMMMFEDFARYKIKIVNVRCERLKSISEQDCIAEGVEQNANSPYTRPSWRNYQDPSIHLLSPVSSYRTIIEGIHGKELWNANPWVFVYEFKLSEL